MRIELQYVTPKGAYTTKVFEQGPELELQLDNSMKSLWRRKIEGNLFLVEGRNREQFGAVTARGWYFHRDILTAKEVKPE